MQSVGGLGCILKVGLHIHKVCVRCFLVHCVRFFCVYSVMGWGREVGLFGFEMKIFGWMKS